MIAVDDFVDQVKAASGTHVVFGQEDFAPDQYPVVQVLPDADSNFNVINTHFLSLGIGVTIKIIHDRKCERQALEILRVMVKTLNQIDCEKGNRMGFRSDNIVNGVISTAYTDNTYEISIPYVIQEIL